MTSEAQIATPIPGRNCGECSLCCKLAKIVELDKPEGVWCRHCAPGRGGCTIYETRPPVCRNWNCNWILEPALGPEWRPLISKMILYYENDGRRLCVRVDPGYAGSWRREPYYSQLKHCARTAIDAHQQVVVYIRKRAIVVLPDKDVDLGDLEVGDQIWVGAQNTPKGKTWYAASVPAHVPPDQATDWVMSRAAK